MMTPRVLAFFDSDYRSRPGGPSADAAWRRVLDAPIVSRHHFPLSRPSTLGTYDLADVGQARRVTALARQTGIDGFVLDIVWTGDDYDCGAAVLGAACDDDVLLAFRWRNETEPLWFDPSKGEARLSRLLALIAALKTAVAGRPAATPLILIVNTPKVDDIPGMVGTLRTAAARAGLPPVHLIANRAEDKGRFIAAGYDALLDPAPDEWHACPPQNRPTGLDTLDVMAGLKDSVITLDRFFPYPLFAVARMLNRHQRGPVLPRVFPAFYNWARFPSGGASHLVSHGHQAIDARLYGLFLRNALLFTQGHFAPAAQFVFLESWNGWLDGSQIEPGLLDGDLVLNATRAAIESARYELRTRHAGPADGLPDGLVERINLLCEAARYAK